MIKEYPLDLIAEMSRETGERNLARAAHAANQRLRELERKGLTDEYAYRSVARYAKEWRPSGKIRFPENYKTMGDREYYTALRAIQQFLASEGSTLTGMIEVDRKIISTVRSAVNERQMKRGRKGISPLAKDSDIIRFLKSATFRQLRKMFPSDDVLEDFTGELAAGRSYDEIVAEYEDYMIAGQHSLAELERYRGRSHRKSRAGRKSGARRRKK